MSKILGKKGEVAPEWVRDFMASWRRPTERDLKVRRVAVDRALRIRRGLKIAPLTTGELLSSLRNQT